MCFVKKPFENFQKFYKKQLWWSLILVNLQAFSLFPATLQKWGTAKSVGKTSVEYPYLETLALEIQFMCIISFLAA